MIEELIGQVRVPNQFPTLFGTAPYRIAIVGESPGEDEEKERKPFVGASGKLLRGLLQDAGINRDLCYVGNICQYRPPENKLSKWSWDDRRIQTGIEQLREDMLRFKPNLVILLGAYALRTAKGTYTNAKGKQAMHSIGDWRGSVFICDHPLSPYNGLKCLATYHPAYLFRVHQDMPFVRFDMMKAKRHGGSPTLPPDGLILDVEPNLETILERLRLIKKHKIGFGIDIEGYVNAISCLSISPTAKEAFIIPFENLDGSSFWTAIEEATIMGALADVMEDPAIPKVLQSGMYDRFVLAYSWKMFIRNMKDDTLLKHWEIYCEFEKSLALQTSIYTEHAYYKGDRKTQDRETYWRYCCKDSAITNECSEKQQKLLERSPRSLEHYRFNISLLDPFLYIELKGLRIDHVKKAARIEELKQLAWHDSKKKLSGGIEQLKLEEMVGWQVNVNSNLDMPKLLYQQLKLQVVMKKRANGSVTPTTDEETLLRIGKETKNEILLQCLKVRRIRKRTSGIQSLSTDPDGRLRSSTNIVGTNTGRTSSSKAPTGEGTNLTTVTPADRDLIIADEGHDFGQCDLEGADSWTVAAHCARLGDPTMLEDLLAGIKPAQALAMMVIKGPEINRLNRNELKLAIKSENLKKGTVYYMCKKGTHGTNYRMGPERLSDIIYMDSEGEIDASEQDCIKIQNLYLTRYRGVKEWHKWIESELKTKGYLVSPSGNKRLFFGRKDSKDTIGEACSTEPQNTTTYATNLALKRLWLDPENRLPNGALKVWPCHQVHDALCLQWLFEYRDFAREKIPTYFKNPLIIAGIQITIPFEGRYGQSWGPSDLVNEL